MRRFHLVRNEDVSGVSGTGVIVEGVQFTDGTVALRWLSEHTSTAIYDSVETVIRVHGHNGSTVLEWVDVKTEEHPPDCYVCGANDETAYYVGKHEYRQSYGLAIQLGRPLIDDWVVP